MRVAITGARALPFTGAGRSGSLREFPELAGASAEAFRRFFPLLEGTLAAVILLGLMCARLLLAPRRRRGARRLARTSHHDRRSCETCRSWHRPVPGARHRRAARAGRRAPLPRRGWAPAR